MNNIRSDSAFQPQLNSHARSIAPGALTDTALRAAPTHAQIAERAYHIYVIGGRIDGRSDQNWVQAEAELGNLAQIPEGTTRATLHPPPIQSAPQGFVLVDGTRLPLDPPPGI